MILSKVQLRGSMRHIFVWCNKVAIHLLLSSFWFVLLPSGLFRKLFSLKSLRGLVHSLQHALLVPRALILILCSGVLVVFTKWWVSLRTGNIFTSVKDLNSEGDALKMSWAVNSLLILEVEQMSCCTNSQSGLKHYLCNVIIWETRTRSMWVGDCRATTQIIKRIWQKLFGH